MTLAPDLDDEAAARLQRLDQRYTRARRTLVGVLASAEAPLSIPQLLARDRALAQSSVYRNLAVLEQAGVVHRIVGSDEFSRYELAEDLTRHHHHHLICSRCGEVQDFTAPASIESDLDRALQRVAAQQGSTPTTTGSTWWAPASTAAYDVEGREPSPPT